VTLPKPPSVTWQPTTTDLGSVERIKMELTRPGWSPDVQTIVRFALHTTARAFNAAQHSEDVADVLALTRRGTVNMRPL